MRPNRIQPSETTYHVTAHGNEDGMAIFRDDHDRRMFVRALAQAVSAATWDLHAYCLMDTHYHLLVYTPQATLASGMGRLNGVYAQMFNRRHGRRGHLFRDRYWSDPVRTDEHAISAMRYIARNPVAAGLCATAREWPWSSYRATAGLEHPPGFLHVDWTYRLFGRDAREAQAEYRALVGTPV
jgi:putative transposase